MTIENLKDHKLSNLADKVAGIWNDTYKAKADAAKRNKAMPWDIGCLLAEARAEFPADQHYGQWIAQELFPKFLGKQPSQETLTNFKNLAINFGHLRPEIEKLSVTKLYKLNEWANQHQPQHENITLEMVQAKLAEKAEVPSWHAWVRQEIPEVTFKSGGWISDHVRPLMLEDFPEMDNKTWLKENEQKFRERLQELRLELFPEARIFTVPETEDKEQFVKDVQEEAKQAVLATKMRLEEDYQKKINELYTKIIDREQAVKKLRAHVELREKSIMPFMTQNEFKMVLGLLHPDRYQGLTETQQRNMVKAFDLIKKAKERLDPKTPIAELRAAGWEDIAPEYKKNRSKKQKRSCL